MNSATKYNSMPPLNWLPGECPISSTPKACRENRTCRKPVFSSTTSQRPEMNTALCNATVQRSSS